MPQFSTLISNLSEAATLAVSEKARQLKRAGVDVLDLGGGDPDFTTPDHIIQAALDAMKAGKTHYVGSRGIPELREAIARKFARDNGLTYDPDTDIIITTGGRMAIYATLAALLNPGDEVLLPEPAWVSYRPLVQLTGARTVSIDLDPGDNFRLTEESLRRAITPRSKAIIINSPNNPLGRVLTMDEWRAIATVAAHHGLYVISDEVYEKLLFDGRTHISGASFPEIANQTITINSFSKTYAMCGWRLGYAAGPKDLMAQVMKVQQQLSTCAVSFAQSAGVAALEGPQEIVEEMRQTYERRRNMVCDEINKIPGVTCPKPEGAFYVFVKFDQPNMPSAELATKLLDTVAVAAVAGSAFGKAGEGHLRMTIAASTASLKKLPERIADFLKQTA